tara:strand:+ start:280 stop:690 length:411 start_codon:yes stop_codon:yes gene_type:complete
MIDNRYLYIRKNDDVDADDGIDDSIYIPVKRITGFNLIHPQRLAINFTSVNNDSSNPGVDQNVTSDTVLLLINTGKGKEVTQAIVRAINSTNLYTDGIITVADMATTTIDDDTVSAVTIHPDITGVHSIAVAGVLT